MKKLNIICVSLLGLLLISSSCNSPNITVKSNSNNGIETIVVSNEPPGEVVDMFAERRMIGGDVLTIVIEPNKNAIAGYNYLVTIGYKGVGRTRTSIKWTSVELDVLKERIIRMPLYPGEYEAFKGNEEKLPNLFNINIEPRPLTDKEIQDMKDVGVVIN